MWEDTEFPRPLQARYFPSTSTGSPTQKFLEPFGWVFMEASLHGHDRLIKFLAIGDGIQSPAPPLPSAGGG